MKINVMSNLEELSAIIGTYQGIADASDDEDFVQQILVDANKRVLEKFNQDVAVFAASKRNLVRNLGHMYEFGTVGITQGKKIFQDPSRPEARLWVFNPVASGRTVTNHVIFRDAVNANPTLKERMKTDFKKVDKDVQRTMLKESAHKKYVFRRKAELVEYGATVEPMAKPNKALMFPSRESDSGLGFLRHPQKANISLDGQSVQGQSKNKLAWTTYFMGWWNTQGETAARVSASNSFASRIGAARRRGESEARGPVKPAKMTNTNKASKEAKRRAVAEMKKRGQRV